MYPKVSIHIVAWNSMEFLPELLKSIAAQTFADYNVLIVDNASSDGSEAFVRAHFPQFGYLRNARNLGFSQAHNQAIRYALDHWGAESLSNRYVLVTNPDILMSPTFLEELVRVADGDQKAGSFQGKLLRAFTENPQDEALKERVRSDRIDSTGLAMHRNRTVTDRGAGEMDAGQFDGDRDVFGATGALALYRAKALTEVRDGDEFLDQDFFAYKEDVDLAWRLRAAGWECRYVPSAVSHHYRCAFGKETMGWRERIKNRRGKSMTRNWYSTRNHLLLLAKNQPFWSGLLYAPWIGWCEARRFVYVALFETRTLSAYGSALRLLPRALKKRFTMKRV